jgi:alanine-synthesizing transaminase
VLGPGDSVLVPNPTYPIHTYSVIIAGGQVLDVPLRPETNFFNELVKTYEQAKQKPTMMILNFPHNPTTAIVDIGFFKKIVEFAKAHDLMVVHDLAYADLVFDGYKAPSFLQVPGAKEVGVEFFTLSKSYNMPGWRVGFCVGNREIIGALTKLKSYLDYGMFQPIQIASIIALNGPQDCVRETVETYRHRRDVLVDGLNRIEWKVDKPLATMFVWARIPEEFRTMGSLEFSKLLLSKAKVAVSPGVGFGKYGDDYVRFALVENEHRTRQAIQGIKKVLKGKR